MPGVTGISVKLESTSKSNRAQMKGGRVFLANYDSANFHALGSWESDVIDLGNGQMAILFRQLNVIIDTSSGGNATIYTSTSDDNVAFDPYVALNSDGSIASTPRRYVKFKVEFSMPSTARPSTAATFTSQDAANYQSNSNVVFDGSLKLSAQNVSTMAKNSSFTDTGAVFAMVLDKTKAINSFQVQ